MPKFLPDLPKPEQARLEAIVQRAAIKFWRSVERAHNAKMSKKRATFSRENDRDSWTGLWRKYRPGNR